MTNATVTEPYKLMRARSGRMLGGVAAGLAQASGLDVTVVRICIGATMLSGFGIPAYILMWIVLPEESPRRGRVVSPAPESTARAIRIAVVGLALLSVLNKMGGFFTFTNGNRGFGLDGVVGLILLGVGISILFSRHRPDRGEWRPSPPPAARHRSVTPPSPADDDNYSLDPEEEPPTFAGPFSEVAQTVHGALSDAFAEVRTTLREARPGSPASSEVDDAHYDYDGYYYDDEDIAPPRPVATVTAGGRLDSSGGAALGWARVIGWFVLIWWVIGAIATTLLWFFGGISVGSPVVLGVAAWIVFIAVSNTLIHAKFARAIIPSLALLALPIAIGAATVRPIGTWGYRVHHPTTVAAATLDYRQAAGRMDIDLGDTTFEHRNTTVNARIGGGAIFVTVPDDATVVVRARTDAGNYELLGRTGDGLSNRSTFTSGDCEGGPKLTLNLRSGAGFIKVARENGKSKATCAPAA